MSAYELVQFNDTYYGVRRASKYSSPEYASPHYTSYVPWRKQVTGIESWFMSEMFVARHCFMSREDAVTLLRLLQKQEQKDALKDADYKMREALIKTAKVVSAD
jgi:hypothetical protein